MITETIPAALAGERLDRVVALIADVSRSDASGLIERGAVRIDGQVATTGKGRLSVGQVVEVDRDAIPVAAPPAPDPSIEVTIVHVDDDVVVVDKPAGLVVHPGAGHHDGTLVNALLAQVGPLADVGDPVRPGIVHRLDGGSSGLLVVARTEEAAGRLVAQFAAHTATRRYVALVWGHPAAPHGVIDGPIGRDRRDPLKMAVVADGRPARTEYEVLTRYDRPTDVALLSCRLETGRTHQIRVHLTSIGHPLVGDPTYGGRRPVMGLERPFLHAAELAFDHPSTGARVTFTSLLPADLDHLLHELGPISD
jgi:23S rRNA pseudouridine1911/1915/1917 synthase